MSICIDTAEPINIVTCNNYNFIDDQTQKMLKLEHIQVQLGTRAFTPQTRKLLRISVSNIVKTTSQPAKYINQQSIEWAQALQFPLLYNKEYLFQIYDVHQFGYNPHQMLMEGKIVIDSIGETKGTWEVYTSDSKRVGYLSADIVSKVPAIMKNIIKQNVKNTNPQQHEAQLQVQKKYKRALRISSIVTRTPAVILKKAYIEIQMAGEKIKTGPMRSRAGELVHIQPRSILLDQAKDYDEVEGKVRIYSIKGQGEDQVVAEGVLHLVGSKPAKKVILMRDGVQVGQAFIESKIVDKNQINNSSFISNSSKQAQLEQSQPQQTQKQRTKSISPSKSNDFTKLEHFGIINTSRIVKPSLLDTSMVSTRSARKKNSVVNHNNNIVFPKEKRFMIYQDRQNERVTYLNDRSFQYNTERTGGRYRGASIGYGEKTDFARAKRENPGVGNYKLPSIWDRY